MRLHMIQGSKEWHDHRRRYIGASDLNVIAGVSKYSTPFQLWEIKTGRREPDTSSSYQAELGHEIEPIVRARYALENNVQVHADVLFIDDEIPYLMCSLDALAEYPEDFVVVEIKRPRDEVFQAAKNGIVHEDYVNQLEVQLQCSKAKRAHFICVKSEKVKGKHVITDWAQVEYVSNPYAKAKMLDLAQKFKAYIDEDIAPPFTDADVLDRTEPEAQALYLAIYMKKSIIDAFKQAAKKHEDELEELKAQAVSQMKHTNERASGVRIMKITTSRLDKEAAEASGIPLEKYYKETVSYKVSLVG